MIKESTIIAVFIGLFSGIISGLVFYILTAKKKWSLPHKVAYLYLLVAFLGVMVWTICYILIKAGGWAGMVG